MQICKCTGMPPRIQRENFREKISFFRELHRRSFAEGFKPRRMVTEYITPCKDLLINNIYIYMYSAPPPKPTFEAVSLAWTVHDDVASNDVLGLKIRACSGPLPRMSFDFRS